MRLNPPRSSYNTEALYNFPFPVMTVKQLSTCLPIIATLLQCAPLTRTVQQVRGMLAAISATCWHFSSSRTGLGGVAWPGLAWVLLSISGQDATCITQSEFSSVETVSVHLDAVWRHSFSAVGIVLHSSGCFQKCVCSPNPMLLFFGILIPLCLSVDVCIARANATLISLFILIIKPTRCTNFSNLFLE